MHQADYHRWWQRHDLNYQNGELQFSGNTVTRLAEKFGTPTFIYSSRRILHNIQRLQNALGKAGLPQGYSILYAMKANRFAPLLKWLKQTDSCGIDACSPREVALAVSCGFSPKQISFTAGSLSAQDINLLAGYQNLFMNCDSLHALRSWGKLRPGSEIGIRVNPGIGVNRDGNDKLQYAGNLTTKFGIYREQFDQALATARQFGLIVRGIHFHTGCGYLTPQLAQLDKVIQSCMWFVDKCSDVQKVNIGGGLGVPHSATDGDLDLSQWAEILARHFGHRALHVEIEPGEYLVKDAGLLLLAQTFLEQKQQTMFLGVNAGFNIAPEPAFYQLPFQPVPLIQADDAQTPVTIVGNMNEALDVWYEDAYLPDMSQQPFLALLNAGAYSSSMASNHCMRGDFNEVLLD